MNTNFCHSSGCTALRNCLSNPAQLLTHTILELPSVIVGNVRMELFEINLSGAVVYGLSTVDWQVLLAVRAPAFED